LDDIVIEILIDETAGNASSSAGVSPWAAILNPKIVIETTSKKINL
jgi:hypothetical protein